ncbi:hypothetical protein D8674_011670 [Pyrus ussuriensis x Pyrus communis]|uniref:Uncharacterized protein n=1 Tax=Pyrus ussuriensis x Pyrus communis TaxID=2448454 RepID=A0A5N5G506_9ROSA|nr:hypothetical protein D8674_011670 [Pyrus ussuriensis x Pyrus communis]
MSSQDLKTLLGIIQALNEHQFGDDDQEEEAEQPKEACCAYFYNEVPKLFKDEEPYIPPKPYVPPIPFPRRFVKQKHDEPPIDLDGKSLLPIHHKKEDLELDDQIVALNEFHSSLAATNSSMEIITPATSSKFFEDLLLHKERRKQHHNKVLVEIQRTIFKVPQKKPLIPTKVWRYLDCLPP